MLAVVTLPKDCPGQAIQNPSFKEPKFLAEANSLNSTFLHKSIKTPAPNSVCSLMSTLLGVRLSEEN